jgi:hypothetical protein
MKKTFYMVARIDRGIDPSTGEIAFSFERALKRVPGQPRMRVDQSVAVSSSNYGSLTASHCGDASPTVAHVSKAVATTEAARLTEKHPEALGFAVLKAVAFVRRPRPPVVTESLK